MALRIQHPQGGVHEVLVSGCMSVYACILLGVFAIYSIVCMNESLKMCEGVGVCKSAWPCICIVTYGFHLSPNLNGEVLDLHYPTQWKLSFLIFRSLISQCLSVGGWVSRPLWHTYTVWVHMETPKKQLTVHSNVTRRCVSNWEDRWKTPTNLL